MKINSEAENAESIYLFFIFNALLYRKLQLNDYEKVETCIRICETLILKNNKNK